MADLFAGQVPTAEELNQMLKLGSLANSVSATSDSSNTFNSATKVLMGLTASFTAPSLATYLAIANFSHSCASASNQEAYGLVWKQGTVAATDTLFGAVGPRTHPDATGFNVSTVMGLFTTSTAGTHEVALIGWKPTGNTGVSKLEGDAAFAINRLVVVRIA